MNGQELELHLRTPVPDGGHGYQDEDLSQSLVTFRGDAESLHDDDHQSESVWAAAIRRRHSHKARLDA